MTAMVLLVEGEAWERLCNHVSRLERAELDGWQDEIDAEAYMLAGITKHFKSRVQCSSRVEQS